jgi:hypothetical protein
MTNASISLDQFLKDVRYKQKQIRGQGVSLPEASATGNPGS